MQNVVSHHSLGWAQYFEDGIPVGYVHMWILTLECGHKIKHHSKAMSSRGDVLPPAWMNCPKCAAEARGEDAPDGSFDWRS